MSSKIAPVDEEIFFADDDIIVSKTDLKGRITYANRVFLDVAGYLEKELLGQPHNIIRHPDMPRAVFKLLWDTIADGREIFGYVKNLARDGRYYWVFAHATPSFDPAGNIVGYHSNRRVPDREILTNTIEPLYADLLAKERAEKNRKEGLARSLAAIDDLLRSASKEYDEFVLTL
ncbi:PAS domain S-box-containing protein [Rhodobium orientis]|uniref:Chemotaxis protein n=1 Tax=Rhodobium orientis TaxID=34017 RepID=A0A327JFS6_9HYPH|nr:PAS domain-containing protein [Rhodobium orientis]MBB4305364.1 PAS domain S-box-containing protein [Rhodobium orientis]MBK5950102.1 chemotaxis protein [Rhodobium orientis]RAI25230.1 chemotaxis protein [Rhodobium orientis]